MRISLVSIFDSISNRLRKPKYLSISNDLPLSVSESYKSAAQTMKNTKVEAGMTVFFWNKKSRYVDHIATVINQKSQNLNLFDATLLHATPPPVGSANGPIPDLSGLRVASVSQYLQDNPDIYSRIILGTAPTANKSTIAHIGEEAYKIAQTGLLHNRPAVYSFPMFSKCLFVRWFDYKSHNRVKLSFNCRLNQPFCSTWCGDLAGKIFESAGLKNISQTKIFGISGYRSSTFYEWFRKQNSLSKIIVWGEEQDITYF